MCRLQGVCDRVGRVVRVRGLDRAAAVPGFLRWGRVPAVEDRVVATINVSGIAWHAMVVAPDVARWHEQAAAVRAAVKLDVLEPGERPPLLTLRTLAPATVRALRRGRTLLFMRPTPPDS